MTRLHGGTNSLSGRANPWCDIFDENGFGGPALEGWRIVSVLSVGVGRFCVVGQAIAAGLGNPGRGLVVSVDNSPVVLRVGMDGAVTRVPFVSGERGAGALFREQIGCSLYDVISLDDRTDMWVDDEAIVGVDVDDREALADVMNIVATTIANRFGLRQPVFGPVVIAGLAGESATALDDEQLARLVENAYSDGHESERVETVGVAAFDDLEELWEQLQEFTGDGHGIGNDLGYCYAVTVVGAPGRPDLVGLSNEWAGS